MKIKLTEKLFGISEIDRNLDLVSGLPSIEIMEMLWAAKEEAFGIPKIAYVFQRLSEIKGLKVEADQELQELLKSLQEVPEEDVVH